MTPLQINSQTFDKIKKVNEQGYIKIFFNDKWILEHHYVVELMIGRELKKEEVIHHINGDRQDNRIENLMLFPDQRSHSSFHNKVRQFGLTRPILKQIENRWNFI